MAPMGTFCFVFLILTNPPMEIVQIIGIYVVQWVLTNARLEFWETPIFTGDQKTQFSVKFSTTYRISGLLLQN